MTKRTRYLSNSDTFRTILKIIWIVVLLGVLIVLIKACIECNYRAEVKGRTGYIPEYENWDNIPDEIPPYNDDDTLRLPDAVMLEHLFPPIGDQKQYGTCVAWSVGYNLKTALNAIDNNWTPDMLADPANQTSPKDLWLCIPSYAKGAKCMGSFFEPALLTLYSIGAASMQKKPYRDLGDCSGMGLGDTSNRISGFYHVVHDGGIPKVEQLKAYLADTIPLAICIKPGQRFMDWRSDDVIRFDSDRYSDMHSFHAAVLVGYDDARQAFRIRNSWGTGWGDQGSIWVDYAFFCTHLCHSVIRVSN